LWVQKPSPHEPAAADAAVKYAESEVHRLEAAVTFYRTEFERAQSLVRTQSACVQSLDKAKFDAETNQAALTSARRRSRSGKACAPAWPRD